MRRALLTLAFLAAGCGSLDSPDLVHDLRLLAMRSDPAEQVFQLPIYPDGGGLNTVDGGIDASAAAALAALQIQPVTVTALVADPDGGGRSIHYQFAICAELGDGGRCDLTQQSAYGLKEGDLVADGGWGEISVTFTPKIELLAASVQGDPYHGFGFLPVPVQLHLHTADDDVFGFKRLVFSFVFAGQDLPPPNTNPYVPALLLDGNLWSDTLPPLLTERSEHDVGPIVPTAAEESYTRPKFDGSTISFKESWRYNFFATAGGYSAFSSGGSSNFGNGDNPSDSKWTPKDTDGAQTVTYFVVVRDGRGGEGWTVRTADFEPTVPAKK